MAEGWIKLYRQIQDSDIWLYGNEPFDMRSAWIDLLLLANHEDKSVIFDYKRIIVKRGQILTSVRELGNRWKWSKNRTLKYLRLLEQLQMVIKDSTNRRTLLTLVKYDDFQCVRDTDVDTGMDTGMPTPGTQTGHSYATNKNVKNVKNERNNIYYNKYPSFSSFWKNYPRKQDKGQAFKCYVARLNDGYTEDQLLTACKNYALECEKEKREKKYIKVASTFLSVNEPFLDYLKGEDTDNDGVAGLSSADEEQRINSVIRRIESGEADGDDDGLWE